MTGRCVRWSLVSLLACGCSAGTIDDGLTFGDPNTIPGDNDGSSTGGGVMTTGVTDDPSDATTDASAGPDTATDPATSSVDTGGLETDSGADSDADSSTSAGSVGTTGAIPQCGDGQLDEGEACDGDDLGMTTCVDIGTFVGGVLACDVGCAFDTSGCMEQPKRPVEVCANISLAIPDAGGAVTSTVTLPDGGTVADATAGVTLTHTYIGDLTIDVEHGGTTVRVYDQECGSQDNMDLVFDDAGAALNCAASTSGAATVPSEPLSGFNGVAAGGVWTFSFQDNAGIDTGTVTEICVSVSF